MLTIKGLDALNNEVDIPIDKPIPRASAYATVIHNDSVLLLRNVETGKLGIPGGAFDPGENSLQTLQRECKEEINTGELTIIKKITETTNTYYYNPLDESYLAVMYFFLVEIADHSKISSTDDVAETDPQWYKIDELTDADFPKLQHTSFIEILEQARKEV